jgi:hypothetical protein
MRRILDMRGTGRRLGFIAAATVCAIATLSPIGTSPAHADGTPPGIVHTRDSHGNIGETRFANIPAGSRILAASPKPCTVDVVQTVNYAPDFTPLPPGETRDITTTVEGTWRWDDATTDYQTLLDTFGPDFELNIFFLQLDITYRSLDSGERFFYVYCYYTDPANGVRYTHFVGPEFVPITDPFYGVRDLFLALRAGIHLDRSTVVPDPSVTAVGGLVTRHPSWFAIQASDWHVYAPPPTVSHGVSVGLIASPIALDFTITDPSGRVTTIPCYGSTNRYPKSTDARYPPRPANLPGWSEPGPGDRACVWTPGTVGTTTVVASITYRIDYYADGYGERGADYVWTSNPLTLTTGSLAVVNVDNP